MSVSAAMVIDTGAALGETVRNAGSGRCAPLITGFGALALVTVLRYFVQHWKTPTSAAAH